MTFIGFLMDKVMRPMPLIRQVSPLIMEGKFGVGNVTMKWKLGKKLKYLNEASLLFHRPQQNTAVQFQ